ncbi:MAG: hypothetical protein JWN04_3287, partial [Myxococcaceae bacterium]|nr:hypothetical protein [Myxococcaceae bacterium]
MLNNKMVATALLGCAVSLASCAETVDDAASADVAVLDKRAQALTAAQIDFINGTYTNCTNRS